MFEQDRVLVRLQQHLLRESRVVACFLAGSYGRRAEDGYSDLDVVLVCSDQFAREQLWRDRKKFVDASMPYVRFKSFDAEHVRPYFHVVLYENGAKVDFLFTTKDELDPTVHHRDVRVLKDAQGWVEGHQARSRQAYEPVPQFSYTELKAVDEQFWVMFWDVFRLVLRGDFAKAFPVYLHLTSEVLQPLVQVLTQEDVLRLALFRARFGYDRQETLHHMRDLLTGYLGIRETMNGRYHLRFMPDTTFENAIRRLVDKQK